MGSNHLKRKFTMVAMVNLGIIVMSLALIWFTLDNEHKVKDAIDQKHESYLLVDILRQSSDDLTRLARAYSQTGDARFEKAYNMIVAIREGEAPIPQDYHNIYWDLYLVDDTQPRPDTIKKSLLDLMIQAGFSAAELDLLAKAKANSDRLVRLEVEAFNAVKGVFQDEQGEYSIFLAPDLELASSLLESDQYYRYKADIMLPLSEFITKIEMRLDKAVASAQQKANLSNYALYGAALLLLLVNLLFMLSFKRHFVQPMTALQASVKTLLEEGEPLDMENFPEEGELNDIATAFKQIEQQGSLFVRKRIDDRAVSNDEAQNQSDAAKQDVEQAIRSSLQPVVDKLASDKSVNIDSLANEFSSEISTIIMQIIENANDLYRAAENIDRSNEFLNTRSKEVSGYIQETSNDVEAVAASSEELSNSVRDIENQITRSTEVSHKALQSAEKTSEIIGGLSVAAKNIDDVLVLINTIANRTNLLALNATIEATRAGEVGRGFAVVASEVKNLANQTAKATEEIAQQVTGVQTETDNAVEAIQQIAEIVKEINDRSMQISGAISEQNSATLEISRSAQQAGMKNLNVKRAINEVADAADESSKRNESIMQSAKNLNEQADSLSTKLDNFVKTITKH
ncbi:MAG: methyl-accepting chemotaxis protein [Alphaproteobacteria bacterium]